MSASETILAHLNASQREAVTYPGRHLLILAGAGSGKTRVLTHRIAHLVGEGRISPDSILAVTFTNKAAYEMRSRIARLLELRDDSSFWHTLWVGTFHAMGLRLLRAHNREAGLRSDFVVYDSDDQLSALKTCLKAKDLDDKQFSPSAVAAQINRLKCDAVSPVQFSNRPLSFFEKQVAELYAAYETTLSQNNAVDFGDLLARPLALFRTHPDILLQYQSRFRHIFIDEYQDTNRAQYELVRLLSAGEGVSLCVVGDEDQSIYRFRGADIDNILSFQKEFPNVNIVRLEQNYRSTETILRAANALVSHNMQRLGKTLWSENGAGDKVVLYRGDSDREEARFVVSELIRLKRDIPLDQVAVFYRTNAQSRVLEEELRHFRIPYRIYGGMRFFERREVKDILGYLRLLVNPHDSVSFKRVVNMPNRGLGKTSLDTLERFATANSLSLSQTAVEHGAALLRGKSLAALSGFLALCGRLQSEMERLPLLQFVEFVIRETGYRDMLRAERTPEAEARLENLDELLNAISEYVARGGTANLSDFLSEVSLEQSRDQNPSTEPPLQMMTLHLAKGLEFPYVFLVGLEENLLPHVHALDDPDNIEEERRLLYVGMTRAMRGLFLSYAGRRFAHGREAWNLPSRFLRELPEETLLKKGKEESEVKGRDEDFADFDWDAVTSHSNFIPTPTAPKNPLSLRPLSLALSHEGRGDKKAGVYRVGLGVRHPTFGRGVIRAVEGGSDDQKFTILFESGQIKKLLSKYANLELI